MATWLKDDRGNKCSVEYFGTREAAQKALDSIKNCNDCTNCSGCSGCSGCENTHCWAGWVVTLAGEEGKKLERFFDTPLAAMKILDASSPLRVSPVRFFESNPDALREMKKLSDQESA